jgi:hypothetical protein
MVSYERFMKTFSRILEQDGVVRVTAGNKTYDADYFERLPGKVKGHSRPRLQLTFRGKEIARISLQWNVQLGRSPMYRLKREG